MMNKLLANALFLTASTAFAGEYWNVDRGGVSMKFLSMQVSARSAAMSGAGVADASRVAEASRNPLAASAVKDAELGLNQLIFDENSGDNFVSVYYGLPFEIRKRPLALTLSVDFLGYDNIDGRDEYGNETSEYGAYAWSLQAGLGSRGDVFNWAFSARFASQTIDDESAVAFLFDVGGSFRVNSYFAFAATLTNLGYMGDYDGEDEAAPLAVQAGVTGILPIADKWSLHLSADAYRRADTDAQWLLGGEINYLEKLSFRAGYAIRPDTEDGISCGLGLNFGMIVFDYGYSPRPAFGGGNHHLTVGIKF